MFELRDLKGRTATTNMGAQIFPTETYMSRASKSFELVSSGRTSRSRMYYRVRPFLRRLGSDPV